jgi:prepilin-type N-terminal cleavage/methylation domain-containing protein
MSLHDQFRIKVAMARPVGKGDCRRIRHDAGYTLLELLVVMGILAALTAIATPQVMGYFSKAKVLPWNSTIWKTVLTPAPKSD